jgi:DNA polymerase III sliding clamp (beta) subunit (PCNA family)
VCGLHGPSWEEGRVRATVSREQLRHGLDHVAPVVTARGAPAGPGTILVTVAAGELTLAAANAEATVICRIPCETEAVGAVAVPGRLFADVVDGLPDDTVRLERPRGAPALRVRTTREEAAVDATLRGQAAEEFPAPPDAAPRWPHARTGSMEPL